MDLKPKCFLALVVTVILCTECWSQPPPMDFRRTGLIEHNNLRRLHNSPPLQLDPQLNEVAAKCARYYVKKHLMDHSCLTGVQGDGENIYVEWGNPNQDPNEAVRNAVKYWYDESHVYNYPNPGASRGTFGHFTQSVWRGSGFLGIGVARDGDYTTVVAKYSPHGNILGDNWQLYKENVGIPA